MSKPKLDRLTGQLMHLPNIIGNLGLNIAAAQSRLDDNYLTGLERLMAMIRATVGEFTSVAKALEAKTAQSELAAAESALAALPDGATPAEKTAAAKVVTEAKAKVKAAQAALKAALEKDGVTGPDMADAFAKILQSLAPSRYQFTQTTLDFSADLAETRDTNFQLGLGVGLQAITVNAAYSSAFGYDYRSAARITTVMNAIASDPTLTSTLLNNATAIHADKLTLPARSEVEQRVWDRTTEIFKALTNKDAKDLSKIEGEGETDE